MVGGKGARAARSVRRLLQRFRKRTTVAFTRVVVCDGRVDQMNVKI